MSCSAMEPRMEVLSLFPRHLLKGELPGPLLSDLQQLAHSVRAEPGVAPDASVKLAGQLALQRELGPHYPPVVELCAQVLLPACERWIRHVVDQQPPEAHGPWARGRYQLQLVDVWLNVQRAGDYNPTHTHGGTFSGVVFLEVPPQITAERFDGQLCFYGPEDWHIQSVRSGMAHYVGPVPGDFYVFPAWQPHSVAPFRGEGDRLSLAFNVVAVPPQAKAAPAPVGNVSLSTSRRKPGGFR